MNTLLKTTRISILLAAVGINVLFVCQAGATTTDLAPTDDAHIQSNAGTGNYGSDTKMKIKDASSVDFQGLVKYTVDLGGETLQSATLKLSGATVANPAINPKIYACADTTWTEGGVTWDTRPTMGSEIDSLAGTNTDAVLEFDVTSAISSNGTYAFYIWSDNISSPIWNVTTKEGGAGYPKLTIVTAGAPATTVIEDWQMNDANGTFINALINSAGSASFSGAPAWVYTTNGVLRFEAGTSSLLKEAELTTTNVTTGVYEVEFKTKDIDWSGGSATNPDIGIIINNSVGVVSNDDGLFTVKWVESVGRIKLQTIVDGVKTTHDNTIGTNVYSGDLVVRARFDLDADLLDLYWTVGGGAEQSALDLSIADRAMDFLEIKSLTKTEATTGHWGVDDYVELDYVTLTKINEDSGSSNNPPAFTSNPFSKAAAYTNVAYTGTIAVNASDPDGDPMTFALVSPLGGWLSVATNGILSGTPGAGDTNLNSFVVQVADDQGGTNTATMNIMVGTDAPTNYNVIVLFCDDIGPQELGCYGSTLHSTPRLDQLAAEGMRFKTCYPTPICSPSRIQIMTGQHAYRTGWFDLINREYTPLPDSPTRELGDLFTFGHLAQSNGYATAMAGKWQLPAGNAGLSDDLTHTSGFDTYCMWAKSKNSLPSGEWLAGEAYREATLGVVEDPTYYRYWCPLLTQDGARVTGLGTNDYGPDITTQFLLDFITTNAVQGKPFFVYYPMELIHDPWIETPDPTTPGDPTDRWSDRSEEGTVAALKVSVEYHDYLVGRFIDTVESLGLTGNTIIMYMGDNGTGNAGKGQVNEAGARVPFIVRCPGTVQPNIESDELTSATDVLPTTAHYIDAELPDDYVSDGFNLAPVLEGSILTNRQYLFSFRGMGRMLRDDRWLYLTDRDTGEFAGFYDCGTSREYADYIDVSASSDPEVVAASARFEAELSTRYDPQHFPGLIREDLDADGMHDFWETQYFGNTNVVSDPDDDEDEDGFTNIEEYIAGTNPNVIDSPMASSGTSVVGEDIELNWESVPYRTYSIQRKPDLTGAAAWSNVVTEIPATPPVNTELVTPMPSATSEFYRISVDWDGGGTL